jgi:small subunit ribosomal protein S1
VNCTVKSFTDFGVFVELEPGIDGLIHVSQLPKDKQGDPQKGFQIGDEIRAEIVDVSQRDKRIGLSIRKLEESADRDLQKSYAKSQRQATSNLGELLIEKMMSLQPPVSVDSSDPESNQGEEDKK